MDVAQLLDLMLQVRTIETVGMVVLSVLIWSLSRRFRGAALWCISYAIQLSCRTGILLYWHDTDGIIQQGLLTISTTLTMIGFILLYYSLKDLDKEMSGSKK